MFSSLAKKLWGDFQTPEEAKKFGMLSVIFALTIGVYWLLRPVKDGVFLTMVGSDWQPTVKIMSMFVIVPLVMIYSKLVDKFPRHKLLYGLSLGYAVATAIFAFFIFHPTIGIANHTADATRLLGWSFYLFVESFGSVMVALFWSFVSDTTTPESAKRGYFAIGMGGQFGGLVGPLLGGEIADRFGTGYALVFSAVSLIMLVYAVYYYMNSTVSHTKGYDVEGKKPEEGATKPGFMEGFRLLMTRPYLLGIFAIVSIYEIVVTILDYQFKVLASTAYKGDALTAFLSKFAIATNGVAFLSLVFGIGALGRKMGLAKTLLSLPVLVAVAVIVLNVHPVLSVAFAVMVVCKGLNYALMQPSKEQLYIPTSKDAKYKGKAWIDMFGSRSSKGIGSGINNFKAAMGTEYFMWFSVIISFGLIGVWMLAALFVARTHGKAIKDNSVIC